MNGIAVVIVVTPMHNAIIPAKTKHDRHSREVSPF